MTSVIAVDWSGAAAGACRKIWLAEARVGTGSSRVRHAARLVRLECGRDRAELVRHLIERAAEGPLVAGLDFAFSFPRWFLEERGLRSAPELWELVRREGEAWLARCAPPFWGRPGTRKPAFEPGRGPFRATESEALPTPKSVFQIGGAGAVGTGSLRGMPHLLELQAAGFAIWPFDAPLARTVLEIYPRYLSGRVNKGNAEHRRRHLARHLADQDAALVALAAASEDAFDAAVSALCMARHSGELARLAARADATARLEGRIWRPLRDPALERA